MTAVRYERNSAGIEEVLIGDRMAAVMLDYATQGLAYFESIAPRKSNRYASSAHVEPGLEAAPSMRAVAHLVVDVDYALDVERRDNVLGHVCDHLEGV